MQLIHQYEQSHTQMKSRTRTMNYLSSDEEGATAAASFCTCVNTVSEPAEESHNQRNRYQQALYSYDLFTSQTTTRAHAVSFSQYIMIVPSIVMNRIEKLSLQLRHTR